MKIYTNTGGPRRAAADLRLSLRRFDEAEPEEAKIAALEAEAAVRRYVRLLAEQKKLLRKQGS